MLTLSGQRDPQAFQNEASLAGRRAPPLHIGGPSSQCGCGQSKSNMLRAMARSES